MSMPWRSLRFLADEDFRRSIVEGLRRREPTLDIVTVNDAGLLHHSDPDVLAYAAAHGRILLTHDESTMPGHLANFLATGRHSPGVIVIDQELATGRAIEAVLLVWEASGSDDWADQYNYIPQ